MGEQLSLDMSVPEGPPPPDVPLVYVASPLSHLNDEQRHLVCSWVHVIRGALREFRVTDDEAEQLVRVHVPALQSSPWVNADTTPDHIYTVNRRLVQTDCDMLIALACNGVSGGVGQEIEWAIAAGIPVLYVHPRIEPVSKQLQGHPAVTTRSFNPTDPDSLCDTVKAFVRSRKRDLTEGPKRRSARTARFDPTLHAVKAAWIAASGPRRNETLSLARLTGAELDHAFSHPLLFALLPYRVLDALAGGLGLSLEPTQTWPELSGPERNALLIAAEESNWSQRRTMELHDAARLERARGGVRRFQLVTPQDWYDFEARTP